MALGLGLGLSGGVVVAIYGCYKKIRSIWGH